MGNNNISFTKDIKVKLLYFNSVMPSQAYDNDAGYDVYATSCEYDRLHDSFVYGTGIAIEMPKDIFCDARARSSTYQTECYMPEGIGTIDTDYRGEIKFIYKARTSSKIINYLNRILSKGSGFRIGYPNPPFAIGDKVGQLVFLKKPVINLIQVDELSKTKRGENSFGSSGRK